MQVSCLGSALAVLIVSGCAAPAEDDTQRARSAVSVGGSATSAAGGAAPMSTAGSGGKSPGAPSTDPVDAGLEPGTCGLEQPAFCETFETLHPGGKGGDIDETRWSFARWAHAVQSMWLRLPASTSDEHAFPATFCGEPFSGILPDDDVRICDGVGVDGTTSLQLNEVFDDQGDFALHSMRIRQPFDFTDRTGKIVWDVDAKVNPLNLGHGWWIEVWITEQPIPIPYHEAPTIAGYPQNGVGLAFQFGADCPEDATGAPASWESELGWQSAPEAVHVTNKSRIVHSYPFWEFQAAGDERCFRTGDAKLNHFELKLSKDQMEIWATDYDDPSNLKLRGVVGPLDLEFSRGYVHFQHGQYNAPKDGYVAPAQTFRWDNIGFDGPTYPMPRGYDVANNSEMRDGGRMIGWMLDDGHTQALDVPGVDPTGAISATLTFDADYAPNQDLEYTLNGGPPHLFTTPEMEGIGRGVHGYAVDVPVGELVAGDNVITVRVPVPEYNESIGNVELTLEAE
jgi:hypothetical protein